MADFLYFVDSAIAEVRYFACPRLDDLCPRVVATSPVLPNWNQVLWQRKPV